MVSDVLCEAHKEISDYLTRYPDNYESLRGRIESLLVEMDEIRKILDTPPTRQ
jgi:hypothetical protein